MKPPPLPNSSGKAVPQRVSPLEGHRIWSQRYDTDPNPLLALEFRLLSEELTGLKGSYFLDVGCGTGRWLAAAQAQGARVLGVDFCLEMLSHALKKPGLRGHLILADAHHLPLLDHCADRVLCSFTLGYVEERNSVVRELARTVRPGGWVVVSDFHPEGHRRGWQRSFRSGSSSFEIETHAYTTEQLLDAGRKAGLTLVEILQERYGEPEREIFRRAGKETGFEEAGSIPAVLIILWRRP